MRRQRRFWLIGIAVVLTAAVLFAFPDLRNLVSEDRVRAAVAAAGLLGPLVIILLMMAAVVFSPIPSAPIALAAGAAYGHGFGTLYVVTGAEAGAMIAFGLARWLGRDVVSRWLGDSLGAVRLLGSQGLLMWLVFISRLMPFVSFDLVSYGAGLSALAFWRFAIATLAGILPASFLLAHLGGELAQAPSPATLWLVFGLGLFTGIPVLLALWRGRKNRENG